MSTPGEIRRAPSAGPSRARPRGRSAVGRTPQCRCAAAAADRARGRVVGDHWHGSRCGGRSDCLLGNAQGRSETRDRHGVTAANPSSGGDHPGSPGCLRQDRGTVGCSRRSLHKRGTGRARGGAPNSLFPASRGCRCDRYRRRYRMTWWDSAAGWIGIEVTWPSGRRRRGLSLGRRAGRCAVAAASRPSDGASRSEREWGICARLVDGWPRGPCLTRALSSGEMRGSAVISGQNR